jgi:hypothetical protein
MQYAPLPRAPAGSWEAVRPVARAASLGRLGLPVQRGLQALQPRLSACFGEEAQARHGQTGYTAAKEEFGVLDETGQTVVMLQLEVADGKVRIVDAPLEARGGASDGLVACAQQVLRGQSFTAPGAAPGRHRLLFPLVQ